MTRVRARVRIDPEVSVFAMEELWYDLARWPAFVDGFGTVAKQDAGWPRDGSLIWDSHPGGRGRVVERVTWFEARTGQDADVEDPRMTGVQRLRFAPGGATLELDYQLKDYNRVLNWLFVRRAMGDSLQRTLNRFRIELEADAQIEPD
ncbi:hypothetical protein [Capillimicrobium parvum]|uniref:SRPBCC family protein n=1 Tax=Capillimicrobium parvum TaxID=2884022 RepID=A0A9E6Y1L3_9ACTN|nr:hypothetical protein [Capillimicrobium parvum]UGS37957.1 hypothetical protein DSM104329_04379 [Capillimicrobium parvum]